MRPTPQTAAQRRADNTVVRRALRVLEDRLEYKRTVLANPQTVRDFLRLRMAELEHEVFIALWLDSQNRLIASEELFRGTLTQTSVYPREVVKIALAHNAGAVILAHNHPSGVNEPSKSDKVLTNSIRQTLELIDVRVLDHLIVGGAKEPFSFAEQGLL